MSRDPFPELTEALEIVWAMSQLSTELIRRAQASIDATPVGESALLIHAVETRDAIIVSARRSVGWQRRKAA